MTEEWRPVPGYEGYYDVSDHGRVRSLPRMRNTRWGMRLMGKVQILANQTGRVPGYSSVTLHCNGRRATFLVHRLMALAFLPKPEPGQTMVRHLDDDPLNNTLANLAWGTASDNALDAVRNGGHVQTRKTHCPKGHPYSGQNLAFQREGWGRKCRTCVAAKGQLTAAATATAAA